MHHNGRGARTQDRGEGEGARSCKWQAFEYRAPCLSESHAHPSTQGPATAIHQPDEVLDSMNEWCVEHHGKSGLTQRVRESKVSMREAELQLLEFVKKHVPDQGVAQLAGNSVHVDRIFLLKFMPELTNWLSYRCAMFFEPEGQAEKER